MIVEKFSIDKIKCYDLLGITLVMFILDFMMYVWNNRGNKLTPQELELSQVYNQQVQLVDRLNSVDTFVEQSKAIRKMNSIKKQMQELAVERMQKAAPSALQKKIEQFRLPLIMAFLTFYYWNEPLLLFPPGYFLPFERFLSFPGFPLGAVSAVGWAGLCRRVSARVLA